MKSITLYGHDFNKIMKSLKPFVAPHETRHVLRHIKLEHDAGTGTVIAVALDGYRMAKVVVPAMGAEAFEAIVPVMPQTRAKQVMIILDDDRLIFDYAEMYTVSYKAISGEYIDWKSIVPQDNSSYQIGVNPRYLAQALMALPNGTHTVVLKFGTPVQPILIEQTSGEDKMIVLPVRISG